jgi:hypothetical protein
VTADCVAQMTAAAFEVAATAEPAAEVDPFLAAALLVVSTDLVGAGIAAAAARAADAFA